MAHASLAALAALDRAALDRMWMTTRDAAKVLRVHRNTVRWLAAIGALAGERTVGGQWLFRHATVRALLEARAQASLRRRPAVWRAAHLRLVHRQIAPRQLELFTARGGVAPAAVERKVAVQSHSETSRFPAPIARGPISAAMSSGEGSTVLPTGTKRMAKVEEPHGPRQRRAAGRR
jgi:excisionase family DNA binding protein